MATYGWRIKRANQVAERVENTGHHELAKVLRRVAESYEAGQEYEYGIEHELRVYEEYEQHADYEIDRLSGCAAPYFKERRIRQGLKRIPSGKRLPNTGLK